MESIVLKYPIQSGGGKVVTSVQVRRVKVRDRRSVWLSAKADELPHVTVDRLLTRVVSTSDANGGTRPLTPEEWDEMDGGDYDTLTEELGKQSPTP